jgi:integrase
MAHITKTVVEAAKPPAAEQRFIRDDEIKGFALRVIATGAKTFIWEGRIKGRTRRITIGQYPDLSVAVARQRASEIRGAIARGEDPASEVQGSKAEITFRELVVTYMERHARPHKKSAWQDENTLRRYVPGGWNSRRLSDISRGDVAGLHAKIGEANGRYAANRTLALLRAMFNLAPTWDLFKGENPARGIKLFLEDKRERYLSPDELERVNAALLDEPDWRWRAYFPLAVALGTRRSELLSARWQDIDLEQRTWRIPETKAGRTLLLPLPLPLVELIEKLPSRYESTWLFPGVGASGHLQEPKKAWARILSRAGVAHARIHDLRHTLASLMVAQGISLPLIGRALGHSLPSTTNRYAHIALDPLRAALDSTVGVALGRPGNKH